MRCSTLFACKATPGKCNTAVAPTERGCYAPQKKEKNKKREGQIRNIEGKLQETIAEVEKAVESGKYKVQSENSERKVSPVFTVHFPPFTFHIIVRSPHLPDVPASSL